MNPGAMATAVRREGVWGVGGGRSGRGFGCGPGGGRGSEAPGSVGSSGPREFEAGRAGRGGMAGRQMASACDGRHVTGPPSVGKKQVGVRKGT